MSYFNNTCYYKPSGTKDKHYTIVEPINNYIMTRNRRILGTYKIKQGIKYMIPK